MIGDILMISGRVPRMIANMLHGIFAGARYR
jgi:hypothetical protein